MPAYLAVLLAAVCFGTTGTAQAFAPAGSEPVSIGAARILVGGALLALLAAVLRQRAGRDGRRSLAASGALAHRMPSWALVFVGALGVVAYQPAFFAGTGSNGVAIGTVVALGSAPVITGLLSWPLTRRAPTRRWLLATAVALFGVVLISGVLVPQTSGADGAQPAGLAASLGAGASYAVYTLASKSLLDRGFSTQGTMGSVFGLAAVLSLPLVVVPVLSGEAAWLVTPAGLALALYLGVVTTAVAYVLFGWGLGRLPAATVSTLTLAEPLTAALLGTLVLGEVLPPAGLVGLVVLAAGLALLTLPGRGQRSTRAYS
ncbi:DMT family transporter [Herbiconiux sp. P18]|uniref:DMT family transporter n=1 Tax=Herbiconiux liangxiaofengii TaxID=3342795 RepID=UPI0035B7AD71